MTAATAPVNHHQQIPAIAQTLGGVSASFVKEGLEAKLQHLVDLRVSQINQCAFCVKMHTKEAHEAGETSERLERLIVWRHVPDFSEKEKAAFAWAEALTYANSETQYGPLRANLRQHFSENEISLLTAAIGMINLWNRVQISNY
ncbi:carboxymuconolactone decarboxylase family protein [Labrenzia sp. PHM005]|uniref:carboxymuconolactone decarboxylase family protein n=1 Tax=Labrenzia sp. PHM005 TaxID=2590016 RepID=UPI00113FDDFE|nr:carboxymuconolactone decarboxylase family protein [Labrenzia sp. PHM005]QDG75226.1 carboxymuconolactone decarboxylase family protein [Labrenzia sp. PHM005]